MTKNDVCTMICYRLDELAELLEFKNSLVKALPSGFHLEPLENIIDKKREEYFAGFELLDDFDSDIISE